MVLLFYTEDISYFANVCIGIILTIFLLKPEARGLKKQNMHGAASWGKKKTGFPTDMHAQCKLSVEKGKFCFLRAFSKNVLKRQIIIFHLASGNKMSKNCFDLTRKVKG